MIKHWYVQTTLKWCLGCLCFVPAIRILFLHVYADLSDPLFSFPNFTLFSGDLLPQNLLAKLNNRLDEMQQKRLFRCEVQCAVSFGRRFKLPKVEYSYTVG